MSKGWFGWVGMVLSLSGVAVQSFGPVRWGFVIFLVANFLWFAHAARNRDYALAGLQGTTAFLSIHAIARYFV